MKTLDYLHWKEKKVAGVASALHQLLADFQVHYTNLRGMHSVSYTHLDVYKRQCSV